MPFAPKVPMWAWGLLAIVIALVSFGASQRHEGAKVVRAEVTQAQATATIKALQSKDAKVQQQQKVSTNVSTDYQARLADLRADFVAYRKLHPATQGPPGKRQGSDLPSVPNAASGPDGQAEAAVVPLEVAIDIASEADEANLQLDALQDWVEQQQKITPQ